MSPASAPHGRSATRTTLRHHLRRALGRETNALCRRSDRARSRLVLTLALSLVGSIVLALLAALLVLHREQVGALHDAQHRHHITATTLTPATQDNTRGVGDPNSAQAQATWEYPPKVHDTGQVDVPPTTGASATVAIWVDDTGRPVAPPRPGIAIMANAAFAGLGSLAALSTTTLTLYTLRRRTLDRRADRAWEPAWERVEPLWSGRTGHRPGGGDQ